MPASKETHLIWIDLEMTGLDPKNDRILEIATLVTDNELNIIAEGPCMVINQDPKILTSMNEWVLKHHTASGLLDAVQQSAISQEEAEQTTLTFLQNHCIAGKSPLCGNSVWQDRSFLKNYMPHLDAFFHYRIIDVSTVKELVRRWYPNNPAAHFKKNDCHRALDDIYESVAELSHYQKLFFISSNDSAHSL